MTYGPVREGIPEHPVHLRHPVEVHPVDRADQHRREHRMGRRPGRIRATDHAFAVGLVAP